MIDTIYVEDGVREHPRTRDVLARFPDARVIPCGRYGEVFNPNRQNFRLQKARPALILAEKHEGHVLPAPPGYGIGGRHNYYFSHMLNCIYDCRYCFLQGMARSANYVLFINYNDFQEKIKETLLNLKGAPATFYSGYDCDSLALESVSGFLDSFLPVFAGLPAAELELRTKSVAIQGLLKRPALPNVVTAFSLSPEAVIRELEAGTPGLEARLDAIHRLQQAGWPIGLRFDPLIDHAGFKENTRGLFDAVFRRLDPARIHSISLGGFRLPQKYFDRMSKLYPDEALFAGPLENQNGLVKYPGGREAGLIAFCREELLRHVPEAILFRCEAEEAGVHV